MMKKVLLLGALLSGTVSLLAQGFKVSGNRLLDANGNNFIMRGVNIPLAWFANDVNANIENIRTNSGSNCVRIVMTTSTPDATWQSCVEKCIEKEMIPMVELHDVTGSNTKEDLLRMARWWASKASYLNQPKIARYILINIANEWSDWWMSFHKTGPISRTTWKDAYVEAIGIIRSANINTTLVVDAPGYGQDYKGLGLLEFAKDIQANDKMKNCLFSVHTYCEWKPNGNSNISTDLPAIRNAGIPVIVGEFGFQHSENNSTCDIDEVLVMKTANDNGIGWLAWSWKGNSNGVEYLDLSKNWSGTDLTDWGRTVINGTGTTTGTKASTKASVFNTTTTPTNTPPNVWLTGPANNARFTAPARITISAGASDANGSVSRVQFFRGTTLLGTDATAPYSFTWSNVAAGTYTITARATDNQGAVTNSAPITVVVGSTTTTTTTPISSGPIIGPDCGRPNSSMTFELSADRRAIATSYTWWYSSYSSSVTSPAGMPWRATVNTGVYFTAGQMCVGTNLNVSPWYTSYCKNVASCSGARDMEDEEWVETAVLQVAPNPSNEQFLLTADQDIISIQALNSLGQLVWESGALSMGAERSFGEDFNNGMYTIKIQYATGRNAAIKVQKAQ
ncbi:MAG: cellulase family glycosylhydrolase [Cytophagaceae bacterium]|jgi:hypothetical protein|nr:cellulase family glycosylhydrolase [Cytophagaceae bacterium]